MNGQVALGPVGRLGRYTASHFRQVLAAWVLVALFLGFFAPRVEKALSGAGWEATGSQSVRARQLIQRDFHGLGVAVQPRIRPLQLKASHTLKYGIGGAPESIFQTGERFAIPAQLR